MKSRKHKPQPASLSRDEAVQLVGLFNAGRYTELETRARLLTATHPDVGFVWKILGAVLVAQGKDGVQALQKAIELLPGDVESHSNLGNALKASGQLAQAVASYQKAVALKPDFLAGHFNLGIALNDLGRSLEAIASYRRALQLQPNLPDAHFNLGIALKDAGQANEAVASYRKALQLKPDHVGALCNMGIVLKDMGQYDQAVANFKLALTLQPDLADAHNNLGNLLKDLGQLDEAVACFRKALAARPDFAEAHSNLIFTLNYVPGQPFTTWANTRDMARPLRIGLVSGDLGNHPVGYFVEGVLAALAAQAADRLSIFVYATRASDDALAERIKASCAGWCPTMGMPDARLAEQIRSDGIDILIDLSGHTGYNRLSMFAWKPAPVQASWLGYFATTGVAAIDYLIADPWNLLASEEAHFTEQIWRLPETRLCFTPPEADVVVSPLPALANGHVTFGCFNNLTKMNDGVVALWSRVLQAVPGSRLRLKAKQLDEASVRDSVLERFAAQGIGPGLLVLEGRTRRAEYLASYGQVDIGLDPFPFTGGTTSAESLWMGVPVLTLAGDRLVSRQGVGLMMNAGLADWVATDADDYVARAVAHASDLPRLAALRSRLRQQVQASPIFDAQRFAPLFEAALRGMWTRWCQQP
jgi:predicted O-linked N-acetylglucosamine transferase (SPINDLY family)